MHRSLLRPIYFGVRHGAYAPQLTTKKKYWEMVDLYSLPFDRK
jgi:hypothetical protein